MCYIDERSPDLMYEQVYKYFVSDIASGHLRSGDKLPSIRSLSRTLNISTTTIENAYALLCDEGYAVAVPRSGYVVQSSKYDVPKKELFIPDNASTKKTYNFYYGNFSSDSFPLSVWRKLTNKALMSADVEKMNTYGDKQGELEFRQEITKHLKISRGLECLPERVIIAGTTSVLLDIISKLIPKEKHTIVFEEPGYHISRNTFIHNGFKVIPAPVDSDGINMDGINASDVGLIYTTPSHQMPTGVVLSLKKRLELVDWAEKNDAYIIEDDYDHEFIYSKPVKTIFELDNSDRVIYLGTFSKIISPAVRISYCILPKALLDRYFKVFTGFHCMIPWIIQRIITLYITDGCLTRRINRLYTENLRKRDALLYAVNDVMKDKVILTGGDAGTHVRITVPGVDQGFLVQSAAQANVKIYGIKHYWYDSAVCPADSVIVGYNAIKEQDIYDGVELMHKAWFL